MKFITNVLLQELSTKADASPRRRAHLNFHETPEDLVQRLFIAAQPDSYFRPHRHPDKPELAIVLQGSFDILTFDAQGKVIARSTVRAGQDALGFEMPPATFHTLVMREPTVFFEVKRGPYDPKTAAEFAPWSPAEGSAEAADFFRKLQTVKVGEGMG